MQYNRSLGASHLSQSLMTILPFLIRSTLVFLFVFSTTTVASPLLLTPCNYPVPNESSFEAHCGTNYLRSSYICDMDKQISLTAVEKIDSILSKYELFAKKYVRIGIAVLRILEFPNWTNVNSPITEQTAISTITPAPLSAAGSSEAVERSMDSLERLEELAVSVSVKSLAETPNEEMTGDGQRSNSDWHCLSRSEMDFYQNLHSDSQLTNVSIIRHYVRTFADSLRRRWFNGECALDLFFLAVTQSVVDQYSGEDILQYPLIQVSYSQELLRLLPSDYEQRLEKELSSLSTKGWPPELIMVSAIGRISGQLGRLKLIERRMTTVVVDGSGQHRIVATVVVQHTIPLWAIYTFIGCVGSVGFALGLEWTIVRRRALTLRGSGSGNGSGGGAERHRSSKSDNVQVHLYF